MANTKSPFHGIQHLKRRAYLTALVGAGGNITRACEIVGIDRTTPYSKPWVQDDEFQALVPLAREMAADHLEAEAIRRAYDGVSEPVGFYKGEPSAYVQRYSDVLLIFLLKGARPEKYAERQRLTHAGDSDHPVDLRTLSDDELKRHTERLATRIGAYIGAGPSDNGDGALLSCVNDDRS